MEDFGFFNFWLLEFRIWAEEFRIWVLGFGLWNLELRFRVLCIGRRGDNLGEREKEEEEKKLDGRVVVGSRR